MNTSTEKKPPLARALIGAEAISPDGKRTKEVVLMVFRPAWAKIGPGMLALPGGKLKKEDYQKVPKELDDAMTNLVREVLQEEDKLVVVAAALALIRELSEEFNLIVDLSMLHYVGTFTNDAGWTTYLFGLRLEKASELTLKPDNGGLRWMDLKELNKRALLEASREGTQERGIFADHAAMLLAALKPGNQDNI